MKIHTLLIPLLAMVSAQAHAEEVVTPDGFNLSKLYKKLKAAAESSDTQSAIHVDFDKAMRTSEPPQKLFATAKTGDPVACNLVGYLFSAGKGVKPSHEKAIIWFTSCAEKNPKAAYNLGVMHAEGMGTQKDPEKSAQYFLTAWKTAQIPQAGIRLAYHYKAKQDWAAEWEMVERLEKAKNYPRHWGYLLGEMIISKRAPIYDISKANAALSAALEERSAGAAHLLAYLLGNGLLGKADYEAACTIETIGSSLDGRQSDPTWMNVLNDDGQSRCKASARSWLENHAQPAPLDFKSLMY